MGMLLLALSRPDDWKFSVKGLTSLCADGKASVNSALKELQDAGYLEVKQIRAADGKMSGSDFIFREQPQAEFRDAAIEPHPDLPDTGKRTLLTNNYTNNCIGGKPQRKAYGEYENVFLTDGEMEKFRAEYPNDWQRFIDELSAYQDSTGKKYSGYLSTLRNWAKRDRRGSQSKSEVETGPTPLEWLDYTGEGG
ncbi:MAG: helix-turn-helix domain-containing protein [Clostridiales bacterium]|nr:helix-turn-helix domain-containing protein [Clostridiales bacterium]